MKKMFKDIGEKEGVILLSKAVAPKAIIGGYEKARKIFKQMLLKLRLVH